jgi:hypothetical protein
MTGGRLEVGEPLKNFRGVLSGVPVYEPDADNRAPLK